MKEAFEYFKQPDNFSALQSMKSESKNQKKAVTKLKVSEVVNGYTSFGFKNEAA